MKRLHVSKKRLLFLALNLLLVLAVLAGLIAIRHLSARGSAWQFTVRHLSVRFSTTEAAPAAIRFTTPKVSAAETATAATHTGRRRRIGEFIVLQEMFQ